MVSRLADWRNGAWTVALAGALTAIAAYALLAGARPLYETAAVLSAPSPALLDEYAGAVSATDGPGAPARRPGLDRTNLGDVSAALKRLRAGLGDVAARSEVTIDVDDEAGEISVIARDQRPRTGSLVANGLAALIVEQRTAAANESFANARAQAVLLAVLARRTPRLRQRIGRLRTRVAILDQLRRVPGGGLIVLRRATTPTQAVGPHVGRDVLLGGVFGMLVFVSLRSLRRTGLCNEPSRFPADASHQHPPRRPAAPRTGRPWRRARLVPRELPRERLCRARRR